MYMPGLSVRDGLGLDVDTNARKEVLRDIESHPRQQKAGKDDILIKVTRALRRDVVDEGRIKWE
jgi:hypothetical protein